MTRSGIALLALMLTAAACSTGSDPQATTTPTTAAPTTTLGLLDQDREPFPPAPPVPTGALDPATVETLDGLWRSLRINVDIDGVRALGVADDARVAWLLTDLLRFFQGDAVGDAAVDAFNAITGAAVDQETTPWKDATDLLIAWDVPAPPGYLDYKRQMLLIVEPRWEPFFVESADLDWRFVSWGGVRIDARPLGDPEPCPQGCIPALDDPAVTDAAGGSWYPDDAVVFAVVVNDEARAYPKHIMEVHEMVNDTIGGRRIGMPYCTLCGSAQAYLTDAVPDGVEPPVLRTTGLLSRSNKIMYDLVTRSVFDTFLGKAVSGSLQEIGLTLEPVTVVTTTWGEWKAAHPDTTIVAQDGGIGRVYPDDPLGDRDDFGPIFPVGDVDPRLPAQEQVLGVVTPEGAPVAFPVSATLDTLTAGGAVAAHGVEVVLDGGGLRARGGDGDLETHQAFWFAWSQFHPDTLLWES